MFAASRMIERLRMAGFVQMTVLDSARPRWSSDTRGGWCPWEDSTCRVVPPGWDRQTVSTECCRLSWKSHLGLGSVPPVGTGEGGEGVGEDSTAQTTFECNFFEGIFPQFRRCWIQYNFGLCMMVNSLCLGKSIRKVCLCLQHARVQRCDVVLRQNHLEVIKVTMCRGCLLQPLVLPWIFCSSLEELQAGAVPFVVQLWMYIFC